MHPAAATIFSPTVLIYLANIGIAATLVCGATLLGIRWGRSRSLPLEHALLVIALIASLASPMLVGVSQFSGFSLVRLQFDDSRLFSPQGTADVSPNEQHRLSARTEHELAVATRPVAVATEAGDTIGPSIEAAGVIVAPADAAIWSGWQWLWLLGGALTLLWIGGSIVCVSWFLRGYLKLRQFMQFLEPLDEPRVDRRASQAADRLGLRESPPVYGCATIPGPLTIGLFRPAIVLPPTVPRLLTDNQLRGMLIHEMAHIARRDQIVGVFQRLALVIFWWHPLVRTVCLRISSLRERICDDLAIGDSQDAESYAQMLVELAGRLTIPRSLPSAIGMLESGGTDFSCRVQRLLDCRRRAVVCLDQRLKVMVAAALLLMVALITLTPICVRSDEATAAVEPKNERNELNTQVKKSADSPPSRKGAGDVVSSKDDTEAKPMDIYKYPITVSGRALDADGRPIAGAQVYLSSQHAIWKRVSETKTDESGKSVLKQVPLPIERSKITAGSGIGAFLVYAQAEAHGFSWRPAKSFHPVTRSGRRDYDVQEGDLPKRFYANEEINLDLRFTKSTDIRGTVMDTKGNPVHPTKAYLAS